MLLNRDTLRAVLKAQDAPRGSWLSFGELGALPVGVVREIWASKPRRPGHPGTREIARLLGKAEILAVSVVDPEGGIPYLEIRYVGGYLRFPLISTHCLDPEKAIRVT